MQAHVRKGGKGWVSEGSQKKANKLRGPKESTKQNSWDALRVWWAPVLFRGKAHVEVLGSGFPGDVPEGCSPLLQRVRAAVNIRCQNADKPKTLFVDRSKAFYVTNSGVITGEYKQALSMCGFKAFMGDDASKQPGNIQELLLHETLVAWIRRRLAQTVPKKPWEETEEQYGQRLRGVVAYINENYNVAGLCDEVLDRVETLITEEGGKLKQ